MDSSRLVHRGKKSWWSGSVKTLCGLTLPAGTAKAPWFPIFLKACPGCEAVHQLTRNGGK
jgi:hypothetical protein